MLAAIDEIGMIILIKDNKVFIFFEGPLNVIEILFDMFNYLAIKVNIWLDVTLSEPAVYSTVRLRKNQ